MMIIIVVSDKLLDIVCHVFSSLELCIYIFASISGRDQTGARLYGPYRTNIHLNYCSVNGIGRQ